MSNRLKNETSPYLLQHQDNPVDWYPWGNEALAKAKAEDKPIFLSIGYAACHWCHVMAHESFENEETAAFLNEHFINIKVDREERPDIDSIYMAAVMAMTRQGGWPLTIFLTPQGEPFWGGTYFPPAPRYGMPSFMQVISSLADSWANRRAILRDGAAEIVRHIQQSPNLDGGGHHLERSLFYRALTQLNANFDHQMGGFGGAPKFPPAMAIEFLLRHHHETGDESALQMATFTLDKMAGGGIYDHLGGGFARYATDNDWLVPHFEKMLYDNGLLSRVYLHAWQQTGDPFYRQVVEESLDWVAREMRHEAGGFYSSLDADSEGEEGKFYVWSLAEIGEVLRENATLFAARYGVSSAGNWEGANILHRAQSVEKAAAIAGIPVGEAQKRLQECRQKLLNARQKRIRPGLDDKIITSWNGLMMAAFAEAGRAFEREEYIQIAVRNAEFLRDNLRRQNGRLWRTWKAGSNGKFNGYLEDYAYLGDGLLALYQTTFELRWFQWAQELAELILTHFTDSDAGGFYDTSDDHEPLLHRPKEIQDNATPSGNSMSAHLLAKLSLFSGNGVYWEVAERATSSLFGAMAQYPTGFAHWLSAAWLMAADTVEVAIVGDVTQPDAKALLTVAQLPFRPHQVVAAGISDPHIPLLANREMIDGKATAYVCRHFSCQMPVTQPDELRQQLRKNPMEKT